MASFKKVQAQNKQGYMWTCIKDGPPDPVTGKRNQIKRRGETKKEAEARVDQALLSLKDDGIDVKRIKNMTFQKVAEEWLAAYSREKVKKSTIRVRRISLAILNQFISAVTIDKITHRMHQQILDDLFELKGYSRPHIEGVHVAANLIYKYAIREKYRKDNPATGARIPTRSVTVEEIERNPIEEKYFDKSELTELLKAVDKYGLPYDREMFYLLAFSGMRSGELIALKETDFDFEINEVRITKTLYNPDNNAKKYELTPPKTKGSIRSIQLDPSISALMREHIKKLKKIQMAVMNFNPEYHAEKFVFCNEEGYPFIQKTVNRRLQRIISKAKISKEATSHIFRHTHISMLTEAGIDLPTIMQRVGHDDPKTTLQIYTHITEKMKKTAGDKVNIHFKDILPSSLAQEM
ncbi:Site-specific recombinase XerD [Paenibacillus sp. UNC496MF]|uniref:tyrosine-type recombinase/integrase n=1 Tax=Paenibacillus sp. UNC496MF TaxID=1502753 RepID=UPI0008EE6103|nr:tyrosine-type recombinase/integrase [Paenibacillus sp. UNC496MF]SFJ43731.1 Site-specific recombinase XerD [Paenibacillus sp. UNC496MF]